MRLSRREFIRSMGVTLVSMAVGLGATESVQRSGWAQLCRRARQAPRFRPKTSMPFVYWSGYC